MKKINLLFIFLLPFYYCLSQSISNTVPYQWQVPEVQGHHLNDAKWLPGNRIIAVGDQGSIVISADSGASWQSIQLPIVANFHSIDFTDSLNIYVAGGDVNSGGQIYKSGDGGNTWNLVFDGPSITLRGIDFITDSIGFAVGRLGKIIKTTDAGLTWNNLITGTTNHFTCVQFLNSDTGYAGGENLGLFRTDNGGTTWSQAFGCPTNNIYCMQFVNDTLGWMGALGGTILRTFNGGLNWVQQFTQSNSQKILKISMNGTNTGIAVSNSYIYRTTNGVNWNAVFNTNQMANYCVALTSNADIFLGGYAGSMYFAPNFGSSYNDLNPDMGISINSKIRFFDPLNGWVCRHEGSILRTSDGGNTWQESTIPSLNSLNDLAVISANKIMAVGVNGTVVTSTNAGVTLTTQQMASTNELTSIDFPSATTGYIAGLNGTMYKTITGGSTWTTVNTTTTDDIMDIHFINTSTGFYLTGSGSLKKTINGGSNWTDIVISGFFLTPFKSMYWLDEDTGMVVNSSGILGRTTDGGQTWNTIPGFCAGQTLDIVFTDNLHGYAVGDPNFSTCDISYTEDAGQSWNPINLPYKYAIYSIHPFDTSNFFVCTSMGSIIHAGSSIVTSNPTLNVEAKHLTIFPNPASSEVKVMHEEKVDWNESIQIFDMAGRLVLSRQPTTNHSYTSINVSSLQEGIYFIRWNNRSSKLVVNK